MGFSVKTPGLPRRKQEVTAEAKLRLMAGLVQATNQAPRFSE